MHRPIIVCVLLLYGVIKDVSMCVIDFNCNQDFCRRCTRRSNFTWVWLWEL